MVQLELEARIQVYVMIPDEEEKIQLRKMLTIRFERRTSFRGIE